MARLKYVPCFVNSSNPQSFAPVFFIHEHKSIVHSFALNKPMPAATNNAVSPRVHWRC